MNNFGFLLKLAEIYGKDLTAMRNGTTLLRAEQSRAEQSRAEQSRAEANCALFASCEAFEMEYFIRGG